jgi:hypothetical protein
MVEVGFINWSKKKKGVAEVQISNVLMPFLVELSSQFTTYSLSVAMSLKKANGHKECMSFVKVARNRWF